MYQALYLQIDQLIKEESWQELRQLMSSLTDIEIATSLEQVTPTVLVQVMRLLDAERAADVFTYLQLEQKLILVDTWSTEKDRLSEILNLMDPDDRTNFLEQLPGFRRNELMRLMTPVEQEIARSLLNYPEQSIGRLMTTDFVAVKPHYTVEQTLAHIRKYGHDSETLNIIYVVDNDWKLIDDLRIRSVLLADSQQTITDLLDSRFVSLHAYDDQEKAVQVFQEQDRVALPVVDESGKLLGIVTIDDVMDVAEEETTEDFHKFGSFQKSILNPIKARALELYKTRVVWLTILVFMNVFSGAAIASFEGVIETMVSLVFFLPLLIDSGGNAGAQSATLMIRALAIGDVEMKDWLRLLSKELFVSLLLGLTMAVGVSLIASFRAPEIIFIVAMTMVLTVMAGSMIGLLLPFVFTRFNIDPASASAPLITSLADILGVIIYFSIASNFLTLG